MRSESSSRLMAWRSASTSLASLSVVSTTGGGAAATDVCGIIVDAYSAVKHANNSVTMSAYDTIQRALRSAPRLAVNLVRP
ncbi:MAG: hypothetical protein AMXMBFR57_30370 [Acidimicrobiia bacterium]